MEKKYRLLKDLPDAYAGDIYYFDDGERVYYKHVDKINSYLEQHIVENNSDWFAVFGEDKPQEEFVWTDELVKEYFEWLPKPMIGEKQQWDKDMFALFKRPNSEVESKPKRIEVMVNGVSWIGDKAEKLLVRLNAAVTLSGNKFYEIKKAIEQILNDDRTWIAELHKDFFDISTEAPFDKNKVKINGEKYYPADKSFTEEDMRQARIDAFLAARKYTNCTIDNYLDSLK